MAAKCGFSGYFVARIRQYTQPDMGWAGDNTGLNNIQVQCRGPGITGTSLSTVTGNGANFPDAYWTSWSSTCDSGWAACQVRVKTADSHGMTNIQLKCCEY